MSDCGFENPELGFQAGSTLLSPAETRAAAGNQALMLFPVSVWCCRPQPCCLRDSLLAISTRRNARNLKCHILDVPISEYL